jgi:hypothetical protein
MTGQASDIPDAVLQALDAYDRAESELQARLHAPPAEGGEAEEQRLSEARTAAWIAACRAIWAWSSRHGDQHAAARRT